MVIPNMAKAPWGRLDDIAILGKSGRVVRDQLANHPSDLMGMLNIYHYAAPVPVLACHGFS